MHSCWLEAKRVWLRLMHVMSRETGGWHPNWCGFVQNHDASGTVQLVFLRYRGCWQSFKPMHATNTKALLHRQLSTSIQLQDELRFREHCYTRWLIHCLPHVILNKFTAWEHPSQLMSCLTRITSLLLEHVQPQSNTLIVTLSSNLYCFLPARPLLPNSMLPPVLDLIDLNLLIPWAWACQAGWSQAKCTASYWF